MEAILAKEQGKVILVIDASALGRNTVCRNLEYYGYGVIEADSGENGLSAFRERQQEVSLVLLDTGLSQPSAKEVLEQLLEIDKFVKIVLSSDQIGSKTQATNSSSGVIGVIRKPVQIDRLLKLVNRSLSEEQ